MRKPKLFHDSWGYEQNGKFHLFELRFFEPGEVCFILRADDIFYKNVYKAKFKDQIIVEVDRLLTSYESPAALCAAYCESQARKLLKRMTQFRHRTKMKSILDRVIGSN